MIAVLSIISSSLTRKRYHVGLVANLVSHCEYYPLSMKGSYSSIDPLHGMLLHAEKLIGEFVFDHVHEEAVSSRTSKQFSLILCHGSKRISYPSNGPRHDMLLLA